LYLEGKEINTNYFLMHTNPMISSFAASVLSERYEISSKWQEKYDVIPDGPEVIIKRDIESTLFYLQLHVNRKLVIEAMERIKVVQESDDENELNVCISMYKVYKERESLLTKANGLVVFE
jgi:hypothetical protein